MKKKLSEDDISNLQLAGIIDEETALKISAFLSANLSSNPSANLPPDSESSSHKTPVLTVFFAILGSLLIGGGIILIGAKNWAYMSTPLKTGISFLPLLIAQALTVWVLKNREDSAAWREGTAVFMMASVFAALALIGRVYHLAGDFQSYILTCGLLFLPIIYILDSVVPVPVYLVCVLGSSIEDLTGSSIENPWVITGLLLLIAPYFAWHFTRDKASLKSKTLYWSAGLAGFWFTAVTAENLFAVISYAMLIFAADIWFNDKDKLKTRPLAFMGAFALVIVLFVYSFSYMEAPGFPSALFERAFTIILMLVSLAASAAGFIKSRDLPFKVLLIGGALTLLLLFLSGYSVEHILLTIICNISLLVFSAALIYSGAQNGLYGKANWGMVFAAALILMRFADSDMSILLRGIAFIFVGALFLGVNVYIGRKRSRQ